MPTYVTDEKGYWHPAKETAVLTNNSNKSLVVEMTDDDGKKFKKTILPGQQYTYEGPCRAALLEIWDAMGRPTEEQMKELVSDGKAVLGEGYRKNQEFLESYARARNAYGVSNVDEYLDMIGYDENKVKARFTKLASTVTAHDLPKRVNEIKVLGGGRDYAGGLNDKYGGFGTPDNL